MAEGQAPPPLLFLEQEGQRRILKGDCFSSIWAKTLGAQQRNGLPGEVGSSPSLQVPKQVSGGYIYK